MKNSNFLSVVIYCSFWISLNAQVDTVGDKSFKWGLHTTTFLSSSTEYQSALCMNLKRNKKHSFYIGLTYLWDIPVVNDKNSYKYLYNGLTPNPYNKNFRSWYNSSVLQNTGLLIGYQHLLTKSEKRAKFFLETNINYYGLKESRTNSALVLERIIHQAPLSLGLTMKLSFLKRFYYYQNMGVGSVFYHTKDFGKNTTYSGLYFFLTAVNLGFGYNFYK